MNLDELASRLADTYGPDPSLVGALDGTEDECGDMESEVADALGVDVDDDARWQRLMASCENAYDQNTEWRPWLDDVVAGLDWKEPTS